MNEKLDDMDVRILKIFQEDSHTSLDEIGSRLNVSKSTIHYRVKRLLSSGIIKGFSALIDPERLGKAIMCTTLLHAKYRSDYFNKMGEKLPEIKGVWAIYFLLGEYDFLVLSRAEEQKDLKRLIEEIIGLEEVDRSSTQVVINKIKEDMRVEL